jgi:hypothetical protein
VSIGFHEPREERFLFVPILPHTFLVLLDASRMTDNNALTDPMPTEEIESLNGLSGNTCKLSKLLGEMFIVRYKSHPVHS